MENQNSYPIVINGLSNGVINGVVRGTNQTIEIQEDPFSKILKDIEQGIVLGNNVYLTQSDSIKKLLYYNVYRN